MYPAEYFDSAGLEPLKLEFYEFMNQNPYFLYNNLVLQDDFSMLCGEYCIHYICERMPGKNASKILSNFRVHDQQFNDRYIQNYMFQQFKIKVPVIDTDFVTSQLFLAYWQQSITDCYNPCVWLTVKMTVIKSVQGNRMWKEMRWKMEIDYI